MRKIMAVAAVLALALALSGCASQPAKESKASLSASDVASSAASQSVSSSASSASSASKQTVSWTSAGSAADAAKGAAISAFAVPDSTVIADLTFASPSFAYTDHVAQATYEVSKSARLIVRKAEGTHAAPVTDRDKGEFSQSWKSTYAGFEVTSYGDKQGEIAICQWNDGAKEYGVTIEGVGDNKVFMDEEDVSDIVTAVKTAEGGQASQQSSTSSSTQAAAAPAFNVEQIVWKNGLGELKSYYAVQGEDGKIYWALVTKGADGGDYTTYVDSVGNVTKKQLEVGSKPDFQGPSFSVEGVVSSNGLGQYERTYWVEDANGKGYWAIVTIGADGNEATTYTDTQGNVIQGGVEAHSSNNIYADFDVAERAQQLGLGQYERYYWIQGPDGTGYWGIVAKGADGVDHTTYTDEQGNVIQGGLDFDPNNANNAGTTASTDASTAASTAASSASGSTSTAQ